MTGVDAFLERIRRLRRRTGAWWRRATGTGLGLRVVLWLTGCAAPVLAGPGLLRWAILITAALFASAAVAMPGTFWSAVLPVVSLVALVVSGVVEGEVSVLRAGLVGALLYLHHTTGAQAAVWPSDARVDPLARRAWVIRTTVTVSAGLLVTGLLTVLVGRPLPLPTTVQVVAGVTLAVVSVGGLALLTRRPAD